MALKPSIVHSFLAAAAVRPLMLTAEDVKDFEQLRLIGIDLSANTVGKMMAEMGLDAAPDLAPLNMTTAAIGAPLQFLQQWLPGFVQLVTAARKIDEIVGVTTVGSWEDEEIVQGIMEPTGLPQAYGDQNNVPLASWNLNYERRSIVRFEQGMSVGRLEELRTAKMKVNTSARKRASAALSLEILRNRIGFQGYNGGAGRTYGYLNDPNLPAYVNVANGAAASPLWSLKTFLEITADLREAAGALQTGSGDTIDPYNDVCTLAISTNRIAYLSVTSDFGISVKDWIAKTYKNWRIVSAPELNGANGGASVFHLFADKVMDGASDDGGETWAQMVPTKFVTLGVQQRVKDYVEDYSNATAGVMLKRPFAVIRRSGN